jgi:HD-GYP domain-containing protein (c-di-GMP phosphodiesterase class II)
MNKDLFDFVSANDLRLGLFVDLDLGWMAHPFPSSRFKLTSQRQIEVLKGLGVDRIRFIPAKSDLPAADNADAAPVPPDAAAAAQAQALEASQQAQRLVQQRARARADQQQSLNQCERRFAESAQQYRNTLVLLHGKPAEAARLCKELVQGLAAEMLQQGDTAIRLLTEVAGDKASMHPVNVTVLSLLLGCAMGMPEAELVDLGLAAFLHDIGKVELPERLRRTEENFSSAEHKAYQAHVGHSVRMARTMALSPGVVQCIAQHHELADGSGFPERIKLEAQSPGARILALVNRYDGLCNPARPSTSMTPHEALAAIFSQQKTRFDGAALSAFIRLIGVYPPGSVVQLNDERHALVVSVNAARPLKPRVMVHEPSTPRHEALILDLELAPNASIRRSLKPASLPAAALDYLQPRQRICYFFEPVEKSAVETEAA